MIVSDNANKCAFSLIEVNLAMFVASAGLLVLLSLFPFGLQQSEMAVSETQQSLFADYVLGTLEGNAMSITNWTYWNQSFANPQANPYGLRDGLNQSDAGSPLDKDVYLDGTIKEGVEFPKGTGNIFKYRITISDPPGYAGGDRKRVLLLIKSGKYGTATNLLNEGRSFITDLVFLGM